MADIAKLAILVTIGGFMAVYALASVIISTGAQLMADNNE